MDRDSSARLSSNLRPNPNHAWISWSSGWEVAGTGIPQAEVAGLTIVPGARKLYAATHGRSAWQLRPP